ncbi:uncharacterized protein DUF2721 [Prosthecobacter fusiformis]|uniref:Uncharacterized protein DUF2721 n=1 Tax=Prosthecobacter fusiformis TaxID=48464 RepID=A0A4R7RMG1_9BACT|nr:DUF2721 domain-containing protein [Prosthecobacter fusiformis]TDU66571.1 uncharacterized protein DUF2721 [Prosthecobacter fusiformis]
MTLADLIPTLQFSIGPVILISGIGLLLLSMTNRYGRVIDRTRHLANDLRTAGDDRPKLLQELTILARRARIIRAAIALSAVSVLLVALLIIGLFLGSLLSLNVAAIIVILFVLCLLSLIGSLLLFIFDINLSLKALWLEMPAEVAHR